MNKTAAAHIVEQLAAWEVPFVFGLAGDTIIPILEALRAQDKVRYIGVRHEESAGFMASAYAKLTGNLGVCLAEAGPAAVHLLNGVYDAHLDRVPLLAITGQSARHLLGTHWPQTINQDLLYEDATIYNHTITTARQLPDVLFHAMRMAVVHAGASRLGIPVDVQAAPVDGPVREKPAYLTTPPAPDPDQLSRAAALLQQAQRPVILVGRGARGQSHLVVQLAEKLQAAIIHTLPATGIVPSGHPLNLGVIGEFGTEAAAQIFGQADVVLVIGSTWWQPKYVPAAKFIQIDRDHRHLGMVFPAAIGIAGDVKDVLPQLLNKLQKVERTAWAQTIQSRHAEWKRELQSGIAGSTNGNPLPGSQRALRPHTIVKVLQEHIPPGSIICLDVGDNTYWMSALFQSQDQQVLLSGHWRSMGFALPAAIAAALTMPQRPVVAVAGDGGFAMTMAEFATAAGLELPVIAVVMNNQSLAHEGHLQVQAGLKPAGVRLHNIDFAQVARACGGDGYRVDSEAGLERALSVALKSRRPAIIDVVTQRLMPAFPQGRGTLKPGMAVEPPPYLPQRPK